MAMFINDWVQFVIRKLQNIVSYHSGEKDESERNSQKFGSWDPQIKRWNKPVRKSPSNGKEETN